jgi:GT2 family glycosyltransferase/peptidoglycan/xylan/chitin deacetylase (PgdA/CDA1 family)
MTDISVVIPSYNRSESVVRLVRALATEQSSAIATEIIVVLDGSTDDSEQQLRAIATSEVPNLIVHRQENRGRAAARNEGIAASTGDVLLFLDDDVLPTGPIIRQHLDALRNADAVLGRIRHGGASHEPRYMTDLSIEFHESRHTRLRKSVASVDATEVFAGNLSVKRSWIELVGGFDDEFSGYGCEDWDLGERLLAAGAKFAYCPEAEVIHYAGVTKRRWLRNAREEALTQLRLTQKHQQLTGQTELGGLYEAGLADRLATYAVIALPRVGPPLARGSLVIASVGNAIGSRRLARAGLLKSWRFAFWSSVRNAVGSNKQTRSKFRFHGRILCYHRVSDSHNPALAEWAVRPESFRRQMQHLRAKGYQVVTVRELLAAFAAGRSLPPTVAITFDDGYRDVVENALPILQELEFPATMYVVPGRVGASAEWDVKFGGDMAPLANACELRRLVDAGWEIGHHTRSHPDLTELNDEQLHDEIDTARHELEAIVQTPVTTFAYPFGLYDRRVRTEVQAAGFDGALAFGSHAASFRSPDFATERVGILRDHSMIDFRLLLWCGWDLNGAVRFVLGIPRRLIRPAPPPSDAD